MESWIKTPTIYFAVHYVIWLIVAYEMIYDYNEIYELVVHIFEHEKWYSVVDNNNFGRSMLCHHAQKGTKNVIFFSHSWL